MAYYYFSSSSFLPLPQLSFLMASCSRESTKVPCFEWWCGRQEDACDDERQMMRWFRSWLIPTNDSIRSHHRHSLHHRPIIRFWWPCSCTLLIIIIIPGFDNHDWNSIPNLVRGQDSEIKQPTLNKKGEPLWISSQHTSSRVVAQDTHTQTHQQK